MTETKERVQTTPFLSVLLPTRDRHELLRGAIETVRRQSDLDWEVVVSDNSSPGSAEPTLPEDTRIHYARTERVLPVTDNWNRSLERSTGQWILMLGDDDGLLPEAVKHVRYLTSKYPEADLFWMQPLEFIWPGAHPEFPTGRLSPSGWPFPDTLGTEYPISLTHRRTLVQRSMSFDHAFNFNMQYFVLSRSLVDRMRARGDAYQSPYPDYYAACVALLLSQCTIAVTEPSVVIGMSPKSFGHYYFSGKEKSGTAFLKNNKDEGMKSDLRNVILPGTDMNDSWLFSMETVARQWPDLGLFVMYERYRAQQLRALVHQMLYQYNSDARRQFVAVAKSLSVGERQLLLRTLGSMSLRRLTPQRLKSKVRSMIGASSGAKWSVVGQFADLLSVYEAWDHNFFSRYLGL